MRLLSRVILTIGILFVLTGCQTTTPEPDINSLQPAQNEQNQEALQQALQS